MDYRMPIYIQLQDIIIKKIEEKKYLPGEAIPSERKMAEMYGVNRMTVKRAVSKLVEEGYLERKPGSGTYVANRDNKKIDFNYANGAKNSGITAVLRNQGTTISNKVLGTGELDNCSFMNYKLGLEKGEMVWGVHRIRYVVDIPFAVEFAYVPKKYFPDIDNFDFEKVSLYDYMETKGHLPEHFSQSCIICDANSNIAELLGVEKGIAVFKFEYIGADSNYNLVEYTDTYMNPMYVQFRVGTDVTEDLE